MKGSSMIPEDEILEIKNYIKGQLAAAGGNIKVAVDRMNKTYEDRKDYYPTTTKQVNGGHFHTGKPSEWRRSWAMKLVG